MDIHHIINKKESAELIRNYDESTALAIALPPNEHFILTKNRKKYANSFRELINNEILCLENFTNLPQDVIRIIREEIKRT